MTNYVPRSGYWRNLTRSVHQAPLRFA